jgi:hypothetical protein
LLPHEFRDVESQSIGDQLQRLNGNVAFAALKLPHVRAIDARLLREEFLCVPGCGSKLSDISPDSPLNILHI